MEKHVFTNLEHQTMLHLNPTSLSKTIRGKAIDKKGDSKLEVSSSVYEYSVALPTRLINDYQVNVSREADKNNLTTYITIKYIIILYNTETVNTTDCEYKLINPSLRPHVAVVRAAYTSGQTPLKSISFNVNNKRNDMSYPNN